MSLSMEAIRASRSLSAYAKTIDGYVADINDALQEAVRIELMCRTGHPEEQDGEDIKAQADAGRYCLKLLGADATAMPDDTAAVLYFHITTMMPEAVAAAIVTSE